MPSNNNVIKQFIAVFKLLQFTNRDENMLAKLKKKKISELDFRK